ncbi:hypothetical protein PLICRDRAFT_44757 [Plicaturopsis crispa FD-325 SS-3]|nr:hypothetical protein PLICRDRAFT_44757 [Plicaturopsis crispa FD-325 SS-3]
MPGTDRTQPANPRSYGSSRYHDDLSTSRPLRKSAGSKYRLPVTLEEFYHGATKKIRVKWPVPCQGCGGTGHTSTRIKLECEKCCGGGVYSLMERVGFEIREYTRKCDMCEGVGHIIADDSELSCIDCGGDGEAFEMKTLAVQILKGMVNGNTLKFVDDRHRGWMSHGDLRAVTVTLVEQPHDMFERRGIHLRCRRPLYVDLVTVMSGATHKFRHLDGRTLLVDIAPGTINVDKSLKVIRGKGMPPNTVADPSLENLTYGNLYLDVIVKFPTAFQNLEVQKALSSLAHALPMDRDVLPANSLGHNNSGFRDVELEDDPRDQQ